MYTYSGIIDGDEIVPMPMLGQWVALEKDGKLVAFWSSGVPPMPFPVVKETFAKFGRKKKKEQYLLA